MILSGNFGADILMGGNGNDQIIGAKGADILTGNSGNDRFLYNNITDAGDRITDFNIGTDKIDLSSMMKRIGRSSSNPFATRSAAVQSPNANPFATGYLKTRQATPKLAILMIDPDGRAGKTFRPAPFLMFDNVSAAALNNLNNFVV
jgi:hypothetical protein